MISINTTSTVVKMTDRSVVNLCMSGVSSLGAGMSGLAAVRPASPISFSNLPVRERNERPTQAPAGEAAAQAHAYAFAAAGAGFPKTKQHTMWAFRGLEPWSDPA
ncbi:hypothetical protein [Streptomyces sp. 604F]|uniref:hypothetical protein n=1 Tax=Streptomyces sp. 604F TaxID=1476754 RepID=UPI001396E81F|nr:hypothetical protein [Streptomyces sp. 604F]QHV89158.1 hypothetical protein C3K23_23255 [Streptomyces sp. 604F]